VLDLMIFPALDRFTSQYRHCIHVYVPNEMTQCACISRSDESKKKNVLLHCFPLFNSNIFFPHACNFRDRGELEADLPVNLPRRDLHQACYTFLKVLARRNPKAQKKLFEYIKIFAGLKFSIHRLRSDICCCLSMCIFLNDFLTTCASFAFEF